MCPYILGRLLHLHASWIPEESAGLPSRAWVVTDATAVRYYDQIIGGEGSSSNYNVTTNAPTEEGSSSDSSGDSSGDSSSDYAGFQQYHGFRGRGLHRQ